MIGPHWAALLHRAPGFPQRAPLGTGASQMAIQSAVAPSARAGWAPRSYRERNAVLDPHCGHTNISTVPASESPRTGTLMHPTRFIPLHPLLQSPRHSNQIFTCSESPVFHKQVTCSHEEASEAWDFQNWGQRPPQHTG